MDKKSKKGLKTLREVCLSSPSGRSHCFYLKGTPDLYIKLEDPEKVPQPSEVLARVQCIKVIKDSGKLVKTFLYILKSHEIIDVTFGEALPILEEAFEKAKASNLRDSLVMTQYKELGFK